MKENYNLLILGGGPGGYVAAIRAAQLGMTVAVIEKEAVGGTCLHHGCIPSKAIIRCAEVLSLIRRSEDFGIRVENIQPDFGAAIDRSQKVLQKLYQGITFLMKKHHIDIYKGFGKLIASNQIEISASDGNRLVRGKKIIIATGSRVQGLPILPIDGKRIISSDEALLRRTLPQSILIVGGGAIGVEFAYIYAAYGVKVSIIEMASSLLPMEDPDVSKCLERSFKKRGINVQAGKRVTSFKDINGIFHIDVLSETGQMETVFSEDILVAVGRAPNIEKIGLGEIGIKLEEKSRLIQVDEAMKTSQEHIYAIGDVCSRPALAHGAMAQGVSVVESIAGIERPPATLDVIPSAVYCQPQVASMGLTEAAARRKGLAIDVARFPLTANGKAIALGETEGFVKVVTDQKNGEILGAHLIGPEATELIGEFVLAKTLEATALELKQAVHPHPTLSEAVMEAGGAILGEAIHC